MFFNEFDLETLNRSRIDDLRHLAEATRRTNRQPRLRMALARALMALATLIWQEDIAPAEQAPGKIALA